MSKYCEFNQVNAAQPIYNEAVPQSYGIVPIDVDT